MKRFTLTASLILGFALGLAAKPSQVIQILAPLTNAPQIDSTIFINESQFNLFTAIGVSNFNGSFGSLSSIPYSPNDTLYFTNTHSGVMEGVPGFILQTLTTHGQHPAIAIQNDGIIEGQDLSEFPEILATSTGTVPIVADSQPLPSRVQLLATNIINDGTLEVGNAGLLSLVGSNVNTANGVLIAGAVDTATPDPLDTTGGNEFINVIGQYYVNPPGVYDLYWGVSNGATLNVAGLMPPITPNINTTTRQGFFGGDGALSIEEFDTNHWASYVQQYSVDASNTYFNMVFVYTNFVDLNGQPNTNITASVGFNGLTLSVSNTTIDGNGQMAMVQFALPVTDVTTGATVTNAVYLLDNGAGLPSAYAETDNAGFADGYTRPNPFSITTTTPFSWPGIPGNATYNVTNIYQPNTFSANKVSADIAEYGAQIGRNPGQVNGAFSFPLSSAYIVQFGTNILTNVFTSSGTLAGAINLPDPTNEPARIEITASALNLTNARIRAEGMVIINASNIVGQTSGTDWGEINARIGTKGNALTVSNFFPTNFQRLRGDIYAWSGNWANTVTNGITNTYHYHLLVVGQNLGGNFQSAVRDLTLTGANSVTVDDPLYVINSALFNTTNLTFNASVDLTQNAQDFSSVVNAPKLRNFVNNTNATFSASGLVNFGYSLTTLPVAPAKRKYVINGITNLGTIVTTQPLFVSKYFANDGSVLATNGGSITVEAAALEMGLDLTNASNLLEADSDVTLSAISMGFTNSQIIAGGTNATGHGQLILQTSTNGEITDFLAADPSTNGYATNMWQVTEGFSLAVKPATGDLYGTEITTIATNFTSALHTWAGTDWSNSLEGWTDNMVIGHLKLSVQSSNALLHFTGATPKGHYGMYVDYLELDQNSLSYSNYRSGLVIDPNLTIYFASANVDPLKLEAVYSNRLVWAMNFHGPNSTVSVPYTNCMGQTQYCLVNANLATSPVFGFFTNSAGQLIPNAYNQPFVLNNPNGDCTDTNALAYTSCGGGDITTFHDFTSFTGGTNVVSFDLTTIGKGTITPALKQNQVALGNKLKLTATPAPGWEFGGWSSTGLELLNAKSRLLKFTVQNDTILTATFIPKTYTLVAGSYYGLFEDSSNMPSSGTSGAFAMTVAENGTGSGRFLMGPDIYTFSTKFPTNGLAGVTAKSGKSTLEAELQLDMSGVSGQVTGWVGTPSVHLLGNLPGQWTAKDPSPYASRYTMTLTNGGSNSVAIGDSYGVINVSKGGILNVVGRLADGVPFSQIAPISKGGLWPFYSYSPEGKDFLLGWVRLVDNPINGPEIATTNIVWDKGESRGYYNTGFAQYFTLLGSSYANPGTNGPVLPLLTPEVIFSGGGLTETLTLPVATKNSLLYTGTNLTLSINPAAGTFSGHLLHSGDGSSLKLNGVVLQGEESGFGFFLGTNQESGVVLFQSQ
jgi:hypothetical protein